MSTLELPCILLLESGKACVLTDIDADGRMLTVVMPESGMGKEQVPQAELEGSYTGYAIFVHPSFDRLKENLIERHRPPRDTASQAQAIHLSREYASHSAQVIINAR